MDNEQKIEAIKEALREIMRVLSERGEPLSDEIKMGLAQVMQHAASRIQQLRQEQSVEPVEPVAAQAPAEAIPPVNYGNTPHPSSNINAFQYDPKSGKLVVKFMGKDVANAGPQYEYSGVPPWIFDVFKRGAVGPKTSGSNRWHTWKRGVTPSHGAAMAALIKAGGFPYQKVA